MHITELSVSRFRNVAKLHWEPAGGLNLIVGENGQGKTNALEAIHYAILGRSFRTRRDEDCLPWRSGENAQPTSVDATLSKKLGTSRHRLLLAKGMKKAFLDGKLVDRIAGLWKGSAMVTFSPGDVDLFRDSPTRRRRFLDSGLSQGSELYLDQLQRYSRTLRELNALLKRGERSPSLRSQAEAYYPILAAAAAIVMRERAKQIEALNFACAESFAELGGSGKLELAYAPSHGEIQRRGVNKFP